MGRRWWWRVLHLPVSVELLVSLLPGSVGWLVWVGRSVVRWSVGGQVVGWWSGGLLVVRWSVGLIMGNPRVEW